MTLTVSDLLCFDLYTTSRAVIGFYRPILDKAGITYPQFLVMLLLWEKDSRPIRELVRELDLEYSTLSPLIKRLEKSGLLVRVTHPDDERSVLVQLTDKGRDLRWIGAEMFHQLGKALGMTLEEVTILRRALNRVKHGAQR
ncbi:DNA-binding transcriptional regulator, MarR family [Lentzea albidocapillata subsp. violacea]|uniref:DNA-binding transcriptional regulator, MarR family n=1 Tax=Lentzea albidocapillata subsp. violacea TaxID=128104 RepID=A0A1G9BL06_9PSEU|nr:DNA-binding transcriptional regulator, MarR family [Lentzea albidocapillata subsp. violacea]